MSGLRLTTGGYVGLLAGWTAASCGLLLLSLVFTAPHRLGPFGVTLWFVLLLTALAGGFTLILFGLKRFLKLHGSESSLLLSSGRQGLLSGLWLTSLLALGSLGQLSVKDAILLALILLVAEGYIRLRYA